MVPPSAPLAIHLPRITSQKKHWGTSRSSLQWVDRCSNAQGHITLQGDLFSALITYGSNERKNSQNRFHQSPDQILEFLSGSRTSLSFSRTYGILGKLWQSRGHRGKIMDFSLTWDQMAWDGFNSNWKEIRRNLAVSIRKCYELEISLVKRIYKDIWRMFIATLFLMAKACKQPKCSSVRCLLNEK